MRRSPPIRRPASAITLTTAAALMMLGAPTHPFAQANESPPSPPDPVAPTAEESTPSPAPIDEVLVTGEQPGPSLWKVTHGGTNVVWVLGTVDGIPKGVKWRSRQVEDVIAHAQAVIFGENVTPNIGLFRGLLLLPALLRARYNPDKATLKDIIPPEEYERWLPARKKYFKDDEDIERVRPMFIGMQLAGEALREAGFNQEGAVGRIVAQAAKKNKVPIKAAEVKFDLPDPKKAIRDFTTGTPRERDVACFSAILDDGESDLEKIKARALAWAVGDVEAFGKLPAPVATRVCIDALTSAPALQSEFDKLKDRVNEAWLWDVAKALELNQVTLAVIPLDDILSPTGRLARLRERGYTVEAP